MRREKISSKTNPLNGVAVLPRFLPLLGQIVLSDRQAASTGWTKLTLM